jgi:hypothetical protein
VDGLILLLIPVAGLLLWGVISPRSQWRVLAGWSYRDPDANEPSDAAYTVTRIAGVVMLVVLVWQVIALADLADGREDTGGRPAATTRPPVVTAPAVTGDDLRATFGVDEATVVLAPSSSIPASDLVRVRRLTILQYEAVDSAAPPAYLEKVFAGQTGHWLVLGVRADATPSGVSVIEAGIGSVSVHVLPQCGTACREPLADPGRNYYLVAVRLDRPLSSRGVIDGLHDPVPSPAAPSRRA